MKTSQAQFSYNTNTLLAWAGAFNQIPPTLEKERVIASFYSHLPRVSFLKTLPLDTTLLEAGAGDGGLISFKSWLDPIRSDLSLWGTSLCHSGHTSNYDFFVEGRIGQEMPVFPGRATAFIACHLIEHLESPQTIFDWLKDKLEPCSPVYLEWPSWHTQYLPRNTELRVKGLMPMTLNFYDDKTHESPLQLKEITKIADENGFTIIESGAIGLQYYADLLRDIALSPGCDTPEFLYTMALWQKTYFSSYVKLMSPYA